MEEREKKNPLWTRNFTIITLGTVVSMLGNSISGFAIGLMVLDYTNSIFLYALLLVVYNLPKIIMPMVAGPYLDNYSRAKVIYSLDFLSAGIYLLIYVLLSNQLFSYVPFLFLAFCIGTIDSVYQVAYESLFPTLITEGNYSKAYSISSMIYPLSAVMVPVAAFLYGKVGLEILFLFNAATFFIAALFETRIKAPEAQIKSGMEKFSLRRFNADFADGISYIRREKGLITITAYVFVAMFASAAIGIVVLPYFKNTFAGKAIDPELAQFIVGKGETGVIYYTYVMGASVVGRLLGGAVQYRFRYPTSKRFIVSILMYIAVALCDGSFLFFPVLAMIGINLVSGVLAVTSYNIRTSSVQSYVPNELRGRFNGSFQMLCSLGTIAGQLLAGMLADFIGERLVLATFMGANLLAVLLIMLPGQKHVKPIYNRDI